MSLSAMTMLALAPVSVQQECVKVEGDRILAGHLAAVAPAMSAVPADALVGFAPKLGVVRWLAPDLIQGIAAKHAVQVAISAPVCVERVGRNLGLQDFTTALSATLRRAGHADFSLKVLDYPKAQLPTGELQFSMSGLRPPPTGRLETYWRGRLHVEGGQSVPLTVRVEVSVDAVELRAAHDISAGQTISAQDVVQSTRKAAPGAPLAASPADVAGRQSRRVIRAGSVIHPNLLTAPPEIQRGDRVLVAASSGQAAIGVETKAETAARVGQTVVLKNPVSGKKFKAIVTGRGRAAIHLDNSQPDNTQVDHSNAETDPL